MGWQDRDYYRDQESGPKNPLMWLFMGSVPLFRAFGIRVRAHASLVVTFALLLVLAPTPLGFGVRNTITFVAVLFGIVLLHEFGHCFAARSVGGDAREIMMTVLGGLAFAEAPKRAWPQFVTVAGGPAVNVVICIITAVAMAAMNWHTPGIPFNPLSSSFAAPDSVVGYLLAFIFGVSWALFLFNILPVFPLDGGRLLQTLCWPKLGLYRASLITAYVGIVGASLMMILALATRNSLIGGGLLLFIGLSCLLACIQLRAQTKAAGPWGMEEDAGEFGAAMWKPDEVDDEPKKKHKRLSRRAVKKLRKQAQDEEAEQARLDAILAKVSAHGMASLTWTERRALHKATARQRQREVELSRDAE